VPIEETSPQGRLHRSIHSRLHVLGERLQSREGRVAILRGCLRWARIALRWTTVAYVILLVLHCLLMRHVGEKNIFFAFCLYLPPALWLLPLFMLTPLCVMVLEWRALLAVVAGVSISVFGFFGFKPSLSAQGISPPEKRSGRSLVVLTNNRGQHDNKSMKPFKNLVLPDVMAFQEAGGVSGRYLADPAYAEFKHGRDYGEFSLVSRYPIMSVEPVMAVIQPPGKPSAGAAAGVEQTMIAARYGIDFEGRGVVLYNVHLPSPRDTLRSYFRGAFLLGLIGIPGTPLGEKRALYQRDWDVRTEMVRQLIARVSQEEDPVILAGDFNMPTFGWNHSLVTTVFQDAHEKGGAGFGFTFPGVTRNPLSLGGPWMRIDYVFAGAEHWEAIASVAELDRASQHRATAAELVLLPPSRVPSGIDKADAQTLPNR